MKIALRRVAEGDRDFLLALYASTREAELALLPWTEAQKQSFVEMQFAAQMRSYAATHPAAHHDIICVEEQPVGRLYLDRGAELLHILDISIAPQHRNAGIGSEVLQALLEEADRDGKRITIYVEDFNPSRSLFDRLGFRPASVNGFLILLARPAAASAR